MSVTESIPDKRYPAKLLLAGEYAVLGGGSALGLPYPGFWANWAWQEGPDESLMAFNQYLAQPGPLHDQLDLHRLESDLSAGLYLQSNIPVSSGMGSSGSVVAAVWDRYGGQAGENPQTLKSLFAAMESHFHGNSSGLDPLIIYLNRPVVSRHTTLTITDHEILLHTEQYRISLVDSGIPRSTRQWVGHFNKKMEDPQFRGKFEQILLPANEALIGALIQRDAAAVVRQWQKISLFQKEYMDEFIPAVLKSQWSGEGHHHKLCGAGGGGFFLKMEILK